VPFAWKKFVLGQYASPILSSSIVADAALSQANIWLKRKGRPATGSLFFKGE